MASSTDRRTIRPVAQTEGSAPPTRPEPRVATSEAPKKPAAMRANEIVRAIGLRPIRGLSGPKIGY